jgi:hypothetical protein
MKNQSMRLPLFAAALVLTAGAAVATEETQNAPAPATPEVAAAAAPAAQPSGDGLPGAKVGKDPKTGDLRAVTPSEDAELEAQMKVFWAQFGNVPHVVKHDRRNGRKSYVVAPTQMRATIATIGPDGKVVYDCFDSQTDAGKAVAELKAKSAAATPQREEQ